MKKKSFHYIFYFVILSSLFVGCAKHNAFFLKQGYHDITSHYNSYFNANELYNLTVKSIENSRRENFDEILPLYAYGTPEDTKAQGGPFTTVIEKSSASIQLHQISNFSDDNFLLLGKAFFMKGEYKKAIESLRYVTANYRDGVDGRSDKQKKKDRANKGKKKRAKKLKKKNLEKLKEGKDIRPKKNIFVHSPTKSQALIWLVKTFTANKQYTEASAVLDYISTDHTFIQNYDREVELAYTNYLLSQNQYSEALIHLDNAISMYKSKKKKSRLHYVMAQILEKTGNKHDALRHYQESIKGNSNYEMIFNAELNTIKLSNGSSSDKEDKLLAKLIKDSKNADYLDQLYYERALISFKHNKKQEGIDFLAKSIESSTSNDKQKAKSFVLLAKTYYNDEEYTPAQENYAACLALIKPDFENYKTIQKRANVLTNLVTQLNTIEKNDSLLIISKMPQNKMEAYIYQQATDIVNAEIEANKSTKIFDKFAVNDKVKKDGKWYFYSENAKKAGYAKFKQYWGDRKLEDNWRRENKGSSTDFAEDAKTEEEVYQERIDLLYEQILAEIPVTDSSKKSFKEDIVLAHYTAANIYKFDLNNDKKAIKHFDAITNKYANSKFDAESLFNLYLLNKKIEKMTTSNKNKNLVLSKYPKSKYAKIIKNPNFADKSKDKKDAIEKYYQDTYEKYLAEDFEAVIERISKSKTLYPSNEYEAKFALLEAITLGKQKKYQPYVSSLEGVISQYKNTEEEEKATELLAYLKGEFPKPKASNNTDKTNSKDKKDTENDSLFDPNMGKDKEGLKLNFGKKEILSIGTNKSADSDTKKSSTNSETKKSLPKKGTEVNPVKE